MINVYAFVNKSNFMIDIFSPPSTIRTATAGLPPLLLLRLMTRAVYWLIQPLYSEVYAAKPHAPKPPPPSLAGEGAPPEHFVFFAFSPITNVSV